MMIREKTYKVLTTPGLSIHTVGECKDCINLTSENTCQIWAFPGEKWNAEGGCGSYQPFSVDLSTVNGIEP